MREERSKGRVLLLSQAQRRKMRRHISVEEEDQQQRIDPKLYKQLTNAHKQLALEGLQMSKIRHKSTMEFQDAKESQRYGQSEMQSQRESQSILNAPIPNRTLYSSMFLPSCKKDSSNRSVILDLSHDHYSALSLAKLNKLHPVRIDMNNLDVEQTVNDMAITSLFHARSLDNDVEQNETQKKNFIANCREKSIEGRLYLADMALGYRSAEVVCSILMDKQFYISRLDMRKNPIGDDGVIVLMHALKRCNTVVYLDLSSCKMTQKGGSRVLKALCSNESIQHLVLSNSEGQMKNQLGYKFLELLIPLFQQNIFLQYLDLSNNRFCDQGFKLISKALYKNATLIYLNLENCDITSQSDKDMQKVFASMKVLADLNLSRNKIRNHGALALSNSLLSNHNSVLWRLNVANCEIDADGTSAILKAIRYNTKLQQLILDYNRFEDEIEPLSNALVEFFYHNKNLTNLSLAGCQLNRVKFQLLIEGLSLNQTCLTLNLSDNKLDAEDIKHFKLAFDDGLKTLSVRHLNLSSNQIDDESGCLLIQAIYTQDCIESLILKNNLVKDQTAHALANYVSKRGVRLKRYDLSMNQAIPTKLLQEINSSIIRNMQRAERMRDYFLNLFKRICQKQDMKEELTLAINERKHLAKQHLRDKEETEFIQAEIQESKMQKTVNEGVGQQAKQAFKDEAFRLDIELQDIEPLYQQREKALYSEWEKQKRRVDDMVRDREIVQQRIVDTDKAIYAHPKSRKKEIVQMRRQLEELKQKAGQLETMVVELQREVEEQRAVKKEKGKKKKGAKGANAEKQVNEDIKIEE